MTSQSEKEEAEWRDERQHAAVRPLPRRDEGDRDEAHRMGKRVAAHCINDIAAHMLFPRYGRGVSDVCAQRR